VIGNTGAAASFGPLSITVLGVQATIGGVPAVVQFAGLAPGFAGLAQINLQVPTVPAGEQPLQVTIGGSVSNTAIVSIGQI